MPTESRTVDQYTLDGETAETVAAMAALGAATSTSPEIEEFVAGAPLLSTHRHEPVTGFDRD